MSAYGGGKVLSLSKKAIMSKNGRFHKSARIDSLFSCMGDVKFSSSFFGWRRSARRISFVSDMKDLALSPAMNLVHRSLPTFFSDSKSCVSHRNYPPFSIFERMDLRFPSHRSLPSFSVSNFLKVPDPSEFPPSLLYLHYNR